jgi:hypothetical protein
MAWQLVITPRIGGFSEGFVCEKIYQFKRIGSDEIQEYRLADCGPYFNVANLLWRERR